MDSAEKDRLWYLCRAVKQKRPFRFCISISYMSDSTLRIWVLKVCIELNEQMLLLTVLLFSISCYILWSFFCGFFFLQQVCFWCIMTENNFFFFNCNGVWEIQISAMYCLVQHAVLSSSDSVELCPSLTMSVSPEWRTYLWASVYIVLCCPCAWRRKLSFAVFSLVHDRQSQFLTCLCLRMLWNMVFIAKG